MGDGGRATSTCLVIWQQWTFNAFHFTRALFDLVYNHVYIPPDRLLAHSSTHTHLHIQTLYQCVSFFPYHFHRYQNELPVFFLFIYYHKKAHYCNVTCPCTKWKLINLKRTFIIISHLSRPSWVNFNENKCRETNSFCNSHNNPVKSGSIRRFYISTIIYVISLFCPFHLHELYIKIEPFLFFFATYNRACTTLRFFLYFNSTSWKVLFFVQPTLYWLKKITWKDHVGLMLVELFTWFFFSRAIRIFFLISSIHARWGCRSIKKNANILCFCLSLHFEWWLFIYIKVQKISKVIRAFWRVCLRFYRIRVLSI